MTLALGAVIALSVAAVFPSGTASLALRAWAERIKRALTKTDLS